MYLNTIFHTPDLQQNWGQHKITPEHVQKSRTYPRYFESKVTPKSRTKITA